MLSPPVKRSVKCPVWPVKSSVKSPVWPAKRSVKCPVWPVKCEVQSKGHGSKEAEEQGSKKVEE